LALALADYRIAGVATNAAFLIAVLEHPAFIAGEVDTGFIERFRRDLLPERGPASDRVLAVAALGVLLHRARDAKARAAASSDPYSPWHRVDGWRLNDEGHDVLRFKDAGRDVAVMVHYRPGGYRFDLPGGAVEARGELSVDGGLRADLGGVRVDAAVHLRGHDVTVMMRGAAHRLALFDPLDVGELDEGAVGAVAAPMSGKIIQVMVETGGKVTKGKPLLILEAMKMEHTIAAPHEGVIEQVNVSAGEQVSEGAMLIKFAEPKT
jgi:3-methylcrotonyl-CoA carboxylase alpha subunit